MVLKKNKEILLVILISLIIRLFFLILLNPWNNSVIQEKILISDAASYHRLAVDIYKNFSLSGFDAPYWTPGYPVFIALIYFAFGIKIWMVMLFQIVLNVCNSVLIYYLSKKVFDSQIISLVAALLFALCLPACYYTLRILTETIFTFFFTLTVFLFFKNQESNKLGKYIQIGILLGITTLIRPILIYFVYLLVLFVILQKSPLRIKIIKISLLMFFFFLTISPWQFYNFMKYNHYSISCQMGLNYIDYSLPWMKSNLENISLEYAHRDIKKVPLETIEKNNIQNPFEKEIIYLQEAKKYIFEHPLQYIKFHFIGSLNVFLSPFKSEIKGLLMIPYSDLPNQQWLGETIFERVKRVIVNSYHEYFITIIAFLIQIFLLSSIIIGFLLKFDHANVHYYLFVVLTMIYFAGLVGVIGDPRYGLPVIPLYLPLSAKGIYEMFLYIKRKIIRKKLNVFNQ